MDSLTPREADTHAKRILVVDDEPMNRQVMQEMLETLGYDPVTAESGEELFKVLDSSFDLVLLDVMMPGMDGFALTRRIRENGAFHDLPVVLVTSLSGREHRLEGVEAGANDFIAKPIDATELRVRLKSLLKMKEAQDKLKDYQNHLEDQVRIRTRALTRTIERLSLARRHTNQAHKETVRCLAIAAEHRNADVANHITRMSEYSALIARKFGLSDAEVELILEASPMHDIGKIGIADAILLKPGKLSQSEWGEMKEHACIGAHILESRSSSLIQAGSLIAMTHHEKWDGSGYPRGIAGTRIPLFGRICAVADVFDALTTARPYKKAFSIKDAMAIMQAARGKHFDPRVFDVFSENMGEVRSLYLRYQHAAAAGRLRPAPC